MKTKEKSSKKGAISIMMSLLIVLTVIGFTSCKKSTTGAENIVGTWTCSNRWYGGSDTYIFKANGKFQWTYPFSGNQTGDYSFNGIILTTSSTSGSTWVYTIVSLTNSYFVMMDQDGDSYTYYKK